MNETMTYPPRLAKAIQEAETTVERLRDLAPVADYLERLASIYERELYTWVAYFDDHITLYVTVCEGRLDVAIAPVLRDLSRDGWRLCDGGPHVDQTNPICNWYMERDSHRLTVYVNIGAGCACRRVQVGAKEVPIFEIRCD